MALCPECECEYPTHASGCPLAHLSDEKAQRYLLKQARLRESRGEDEYENLTQRVTRLERLVEALIKRFEAR